MSVSSLGNNSGFAEFMGFLGQEFQAVVEKVLTMGLPGKLSQSTSSSQNKAREYIPQGTPFAIHKFNPYGVNQYTLASGERVTVILDHDNEQIKLARSNRNGDFRFSNGVDYQGMVDQIHAMKDNQFATYSVVEA